MGTVVQAESPLIVTFSMVTVVQAESPLMTHPEKCSINDPADQFLRTPDTYQDTKLSRNYSLPENCSSIWLGNNFACYAFSYIITAVT